MCYTTQHFEMIFNPRKMLCSKKEYGNIPKCVIVNSPQTNYHRKVSVYKYYKFRQASIEYSLKKGVTKASICYEVNRQYVYRWRKRYDGTKASLKDYSRRPKSHPNQSTPAEIKLIVDLWHKNKEFGLDYLYGKLKREHTLY